jgi:hypothetical protein
MSAACNPLQSASGAASSFLPADVRPWVDGDMQGQVSIPFLDEITA